MSKVYMELICDDDVAIELFSYPLKHVDVITSNNNPDVIIEMGGERYREENKDVKGETL